MKYLWGSILVMLLVGVGCKKQSPESARIDQQAVVSQSVNPVVEVDYSALLGKVVALEDSLFAHPRDTGAMQALAVVAFDTISGSFMVAGKGVANERLPKGGREAARRTAAMRTAERWALYLKAWRLGQRVSFGTPIGGRITYSKLMREAEKDDTLLLLVQIPLGSVEVAERK